MILALLQAEGHGLSDGKRHFAMQAKSKATRTADTAVQLREKDFDWQIASRGKKQKKPVVNGTSSNGGLKGVPNKTRDFWQFSVTRLEEKTTEDAVRRHLQGSGIEVREIWMLGSKVKGTRTAKIRVAREHRERAKNPELWPIHCQIRDWDYGQRKDRKSN